MEYDVIIANNPEAIARRLNERPDWEVISITCETAYGIASYSAFIRRARQMAAVMRSLPPTGFSL